jgi:hypothetical protein
MPRAPVDRQESPPGVQPRARATVCAHVVVRAPLAVLALALACSVDSPSGFTGVSGGTAASTASTTVPTTGSEGTGDDATSSSSGGATGESSASTSGGDGPASTEAGESSGGSEGASSEASTGDGGTSLDPDLDIPAMGEHCTSPGDLSECPGIAVCRFATVEYGICESCDACGNLNAPCVEGTDCDILFSCYAGACTNFCTLGTSECGPVEDCLDIGHPTRGVCNPFA